MNLFSLRNGFWMALALTVLVGSGFDFIALRQSAITDGTGEMVTLSYQVINETSRIAQDYDRMQSSFLKNRTDLESLASLRIHFTNLRNLTSDNPEQKAEVEKLAILLPLNDENTVSIFSEEQEAMILRNLHKIDDNEENLLKTRLESDRHQNKIARNQILVASTVDILLLAIIGVVWLIDSRHRRRTEETLSEAIQSISKANFELEQASLSKTHLLRATAHDLRNPLGSIQGLADLISEESTHPTITELTGIIRQVSSQTLGLVNQLVDPKALATGTPEQQMKDFDMVKCLEDVCLSQQPLALKKNQSVSFTHEQPTLVMKGDPSKIWDLFVNLVGNAIKFSPTDALIKIHARKADGTVIVDVEDQGPGMSAEDQAKAFQKYQRLSAQPTGGEASSGLGLFLVKEIIDAHDGKIEILGGHDGRGSCFRVTLPVSLPRRIGLDPGPSIGV